MKEVCLTTGDEDPCEIVVIVDEEGIVTTDALIWIDFIFRRL